MFDEIDGNENAFFESNDYDINEGDYEKASNLLLSQDNDSNKITPILFNQLFSIVQSDTYSIDHDYDIHQREDSQFDKQSNSPSSNDDNDSKPSDTKSCSNVFSVTKDYSLRENTKERMKKKVEHAKTLLGEKIQRDNNNYTIEMEETIQINEKKPKVKYTTKDMTFAEKKDIKILRNRISAQKSRDKQKMVMTNLIQTNSSLRNENEKLKKMLTEQQNNNLFMMDVMNQCKNCKETLRLMKQQPTSYVSEDNIVSTGGFTKKWGATLSFVGLLCFFGFIMFLGHNTVTSGNNYNHYVNKNHNKNRMLTQLDHLPSTRNTADFPITKYVDNSEDLLVTDGDSNDNHHRNNDENNNDYYITNDAIKKIVDSHPLKNQIIELLNKNYPIKKDSSKRNINIMIALREQFLIGLLNKLQITNSNSLQVNLSKRKNLQSEEGRNRKESQMMSYEFPICYNPDHVEYEMKKLPSIPDTSDNTLPVTFDVNTQGQKQNFNSKVQTVYINNYLTTTSADLSSSLSSNQIDFESLIENLNNKKEGSNSQNQGDCQYFHFIFPVNTIANEEEEEEEMTTDEEPLISSVNHTYTNNNGNNSKRHEDQHDRKRNNNNNNNESLYEVGCKVFSITKIIK